MLSATSELINTFIAAKKLIFKFAAASTFYEDKNNHMKVALEKILSVSGKPGIFQLIAGGKNVIVAESLIDGKRTPIHPSQRVSSLADISIFTIEEDVPLKDVFEKMKTHYNGGAALDHKSESKSLRAEMEKFLPTYDAERVYDSDIKKLFQWYNILQSKEMLEFEAEAENAE